MIQILGCSPYSKKFSNIRKEILEKTSEGIFTNCVCLREKFETTLVKTRLVIIPITTATSGAGMIFIFRENGS